MPDRDESTPPAAIPSIDPSRWEEHEGFRETLLLHFTEPTANTVLRGLGSLLAEMVFEQADRWPAHPEGVTRSELRAALADLRYLEGFLSSIGEERRLCSLDKSDSALSELSERGALAIGKVAGLIEAELGTSHGRQHS